MHKNLPALAAGLCALAASAAFAASETVTINAIDANSVGAKIGTVRVSDTKDGLELTPNLKNLPPGDHGFHIHANGNCGPGVGPNGPPA